MRKLFNSSTIFLMLLACSFFATSAQEVKDSVPVIKSVADSLTNTQNERAASFPGGNSEYIKFLRENIHYPVFAFENGIRGKVWLQFIVEKDGSITDAKVIRGIGGGCDEEALRVIKIMPVWIPGKHKGKAVRCTFTFPIEFILQ